MALLEQHADILDAELRQVLCRALILVRNRGLIQSSTLLALFFKLFKCPDKPLREMLYKHIVSDIKRLNAKHKNNEVNK
jgi:protein SDA1